MNTSGDIDRLRSAEKRAQAVIEAANQDAQRIRTEAAARVAELNQAAERELGAWREQHRAEARREEEALRAKSEAQLAKARAAVSSQLQAGKAAAVEAVIQELMPR